MHWFYLTDSHERVSVVEAQLGALAASGVLRATTPVWHKGMTEWTPCGELKPELFTGERLRHGPQAQGSWASSGSGVPAASPDGIIMKVAGDLAQYSPWITLSGIFMIIGGIGEAVFTLMMILAGATESPWLHPLKEVMETGPVGRSGIVGILAIFNAIMAVLFIIEGILLLRCSRAARHSRRSGDAMVLAHAVPNAGRFFMLAALAAMVGVLLAAGLSLWQSWPRSGPPSAPAEEGVKI